MREKEGMAYVTKKDTMEHPARTQLYNYRIPIAPGRISALQGTVPCKETSQMSHSLRGTGMADRKGMHVLTTRCIGVLTTSPFD